MSYLEFHFWWTLPVLILTFLLSRPLRNKLGPRAQACAFLNAILSVVYTTPWDNYLVYKGIWFYGSDRVIGTLGYVPIEEYLFFILQSLSGSWFILWWWGRGLIHQKIESLETTSPWSQKIGVTVYAILFVFGIYCLTEARSLYLGLILAWAAPVLLAQWWFVGDLIIKDWRSFLSGFLLITGYLWAADRFAILNGIWSLSETYTLGLVFWDLPLEEAVFFAVTNLLLIQGVVLFVHPLADKRIRKKWPILGQTKSISTGLK